MIAYSNQQMTGGITTSPTVIIVSNANWAKPTNRGRKAETRKTLSHAEMVAAAKNSSPPQAWFDEDVAELRRPQN